MQSILMKTPHQLFVEKAMKKFKFNKMWEENPYVQCIGETIAYKQGNGNISPTFL